MGDTVTGLMSLQGTSHAMGCHHPNGLGDPWKAWRAQRSWRDEATRVAPRQGLVQGTRS